MVVVWAVLIQTSQAYKVYLVVALAAVLFLVVVPLVIPSQEMLMMILLQMVGDMMVDLELRIQLVLVVVELEELVNQMHNLIPIEDLGVLEYKFLIHSEIHYQHLDHLVVE